MYIGTRIFMCIYILVYAQYMCVDKLTCVDVYIYIYIFVHTSVFVRVYIYTYMRVCMCV